MKSAERKAACLAVLLFLELFVICMLFSSSAYADEAGTMYLKEQSFAYLFPEENRDYAAAVYGIGEAITVQDRIRIKTESCKTGELFYKTEHLGRILYIPAFVLSETRPQWTYRAKIVFRELILRPGAKLYIQPFQKSKAVQCGNAAVYTIGETRLWYKLFYKGKTVFIRKTDPSIECVKDTVFPDIQVSDMPHSQRTTLKARVQYIYSLLPPRARGMIEKKLKSIHVVKELPNARFRKKGASAYACSNGFIYLREDMNPKSSCTVEQSLLHELGHMLQYAEDEQSLGIQTLPSIPDKNLLELRSYYLQDSEYLAETFEIYVKMPDYLKEQARENYDYFHKLVQ